MWSHPQTAVIKAGLLKPEEGPKMAAGGTRNYKADLIKGVHVFLQCPTAAILSMNKRPKVLFRELEKARHVFPIRELNLVPVLGDFPEASNLTHSHLLNLGFSPSYC